jgi:hypothetical protein
MDNEEIESFHAYSAGDQRNIGAEAAKFELSGLLYVPLI